jgi:hypothetical protein
MARKPCMAHKPSVPKKTKSVQLRGLARKEACCRSAALRAQQHIAHAAELLVMFPSMHRCNGWGWASMGQ